MIPPAYDIILENPIEKTEDTRATVDMLYEMPRPFTLNIFALRSIPNTQLSIDLKNKGLEVPPIENSYHANYFRTLGNVIVFAISVFKIPKWLFKILRNKIYPAHDKQVKYPILFIFFRQVYYFKRAFDHLRFMDFSVIPGKTGYFLWKLKIIKFWQRFILRNYNLQKIT